MTVSFTLNNISWFVIRLLKRSLHFHFSPEGHSRPNLEIFSIDTLSNTNWFRDNSCVLCSESPSCNVLLVPSPSASQGSFPCSSNEIRCGLEMQAPFQHGWGGFTRLHSYLRSYWQFMTAEKKKKSLSFVPSLVLGYHPAPKSWQGNLLVMNAQPYLSPDSNLFLSTLCLGLLPSVPAGLLSLRPMSVWWLPGF